MLARVKVLLVDDLEENLLALSALLRRDDVELLKARSGPEALEALLANDVALAFLDVQMPDMDGFQLAELMRGSERTRHVPIIFITAGVRDRHRIFKGYETGAVDFLYKPVDPHILKNKADVFFQLYRQKQQLAQELQDRTERLRLNEMFTAVLGHDLRNPLGAMLASARALEYSSDEGVRKIGARMVSSGTRMSRMIDDVLDLARARLGGGIPLRPENADIVVLTQRLVQEHQSAYPACRIEVRSNGDLSGEWDPSRIAQAISNLIGNALQHGEAGAPVEVQLDGSRSDTVTLSIVNDGTIPAEVLCHLFDPFHGPQRSARGRSEGLGLGLYIVQQIVQAHGGAIEVDSGNENRTRFRISVPRRIVNPA